MEQLILVCTVGGSHHPIITAIETLRPDFVCFICSDRDPATGVKGSIEQITGKGSVIKEDPQAVKTSLPNIPTQVGLGSEQYEVLCVPTDDLDQAYIIIQEGIGSLSKRFPNCRMVADYTGGTKTMTAALVMVVLEAENVSLQLVTGARANLLQVEPGTQYGTPANISYVRLQRAMAPYLNAWKRYAYSEAEAGFSRICNPPDCMLRGRLQRARDLSRAFSAWDRFDHKTSFEILDAYRASIGKTFGVYLGVIRMLNTRSEKQEVMRLFDLWRNAQRRAEQGLFDDAVARVYRLLEWTAQWILRTQCGIDTSDVPEEKFQLEVKLQSDGSGKFQAGLLVSWDLIGKLTQGTAAKFINKFRNHMQDRIRIRNYSILAHGFDPVGEDKWGQIYSWIENEFIPMLREEAVGVGVHIEPPQLPTELPLD